MKTRYSVITFGMLFAMGLSAQIIGRNLIVNGDAETGPASGANPPVASVPGWTRVSNADVVAYGDSGYFALDAPAPFNRGAKYFYGGPNNSASSLSQDIDLSTAASGVDAGTMVFTLAGYLGGTTSEKDQATLTAVFKSAGGQTLKSVTIGPVDNSDPNLDIEGLMQRHQIGSVPASTRRITITLDLKRISGGNAKWNYAAADGLSLVLKTPATPDSVLDTNLVTNPGAESGTGLNSVTGDYITPDIPGWARTGQFEVVPYIVDGDFPPTAPGPTDRGKNYFSGGPNTASSSGYQYIDVSSAAGPIDAGFIRFAVSAYLGGWDAQEDSAAVTAQFLDWSGRVLGTAKLGPVTAAERKSQTGILLRSQSGTVPAGTRQIQITLQMTRAEGVYDDGYADNISLVLSDPNGGSRPSIKENGVVTASAFGGYPNVAPGTWIEIYGKKLSTTSRMWTGNDFTGATAPTILDGVRVSIGGQPAFVYYISPEQINALTPSNLGTGPQTLSVTTSGGSSYDYTVNVTATQAGLLAPLAFQLAGRQYVGALLTDNTTFVLPTGSIPGLAARPARPGETITIYGIGFGPVSPHIAAGTVVTQANSIASTCEILFGSIPATLTYNGLAPNLTGLYQFNLVVPSVPDNDAVPLTIKLGGVTQTQTLFIPVRRLP